MSFPVRLPYPAAGEVTVTWSSADDTAAAGADYTAVAAATLTFAAGETEKHAVVRTLDDALDEDAERFTVTLDAQTGAAALDPDASVAAAVIEDADDPPAFGVADGRGTEADEVPFEVTLLAPSGRALAVTWSTADITAEAGVDYTAVAGAALTFAPGDTRATLAVRTLSDAAVEPNETFAVTVSRAAYAGEAGSGQSATATGTVVDVESVPAAPTGLAATAAGARRVDLAWTAPAAGVVSGYRVEASADGGANWSERVSDTGSTAPSWSVDGLAPGRTRHFRVRALGPRGAGPASEPASAVTHHGVLGIEIVSTPRRRRHLRRGRGDRGGGGAQRDRAGLQSAARPGGRR